MADQTIMMSRPPRDEEKKLMLRIQQYSRDHDWIERNRSELLEKYPDKYIAVSKQSVRYSADSMKEIVEKIVEANESIGDFVIDFISTKKISLLF